MAKPWTMGREVHDVLQTRPAGATFPLRERYGLPPTGDTGDFRSTWISRGYWRDALGWAEEFPREGRRRRAARRRRSAPAVRR
jgi:hypothetical protein